MREPRKKEMGLVLPCVTRNIEFFLLSIHENKIARELAAAYCLNQNFHHETHGAAFRGEPLSEP
jgi:hypothetical protein